MNQKNLNAFLSLGYGLDYSEKKYKISLSSINSSDYVKESEDSLIKIGSNYLMNSISKNFVCNKKHLVPISGGLDSRAILAGLLEHTSAENIYTYTFGTPNTLDYDIGSKIAKMIGTRHTNYPLTEYKYEQSELIDISSRVDKQTLLFHHGPVDHILKQYSGCIYWSGFMGETLSGDHLPKQFSKSLNEAKYSFLKANQHVKSINLMNIENRDLLDLLECDEYDPTIITYEEQLDFHNRQIKFIAPHILMKGFKYKTPFLDQDWINFILSIDNSYRKNQYLYKKILLNTFPDIFTIPTKGSFGRSLNDGKMIKLSYRLAQKIQKLLSAHFPIILNPHTNYINFDEGIRSRLDLKQIIYQNIMDLQDRKILEWIDIDKIWFNHMNRNNNHADALIVLASLEIHLKNNKIF